jgi:hypothetical protein
LELIQARPPLAVGLELSFSTANRIQTFPSLGADSSCSISTHGPLDWNLKAEQIGSALGNFGVSEQFTASTACFATSYVLT